MLLRFKGWQGKRVSGELVWSKENGFVCEVGNAERVIGLLTEPQSDFVIDANEPLWIAGAECFENTSGLKKALDVLLLEGVGHWQDFLNWDDSKCADVAGRTSLTAKVIGEWKARLMARGNELTGETVEGG